MGFPFGRVKESGNPKNALYASEWPSTTSTEGDDIGYWSYYVKAYLY